MEHLKHKMIWSGLIINAKHSCENHHQTGFTIKGADNSIVHNTLSMTYLNSQSLRLHHLLSVTLFVVIFIVSTDAVFLVAVNNNETLSRRTRNNVECLREERFYRNPNRPVHKIWTNIECAKYFLCLDGEVFEFKCSDGLLFDVVRQICDFKQNVDNCDMGLDVPAPRPLLNDTDCSGDNNQLGCGDGTCLPEEYFCDGSIDCPDGSDEGWCDIDHDPKSSNVCEPLNCRLPDCFCTNNGTHIPGDLSAQEIPQMVLLTFEGFVNHDNWELYSKIILNKHRRNPNGCPIKATFFISHSYTNYQYVQKLWNDGHEIGVNSITHRGPELWWSNNATIEDWFDEMVGQANILHKFARVRLEDMSGMRVPFLRVGWNRQFLMMEEFGFMYDASIVAPFSNPPLWPYTLDYKIPHNCISMNQNCPTRSYPGIWEMVINQLEAGDGKCALIESCSKNLSGDDIYQMLTHNFKRHYMSNRAPLSLHFQSTWFKKENYMKAFLKFLDDLHKLPDIYFITNQQAIHWIRNPKTITQIHQFDSWKCLPKQLGVNEQVCNVSNACILRSRVLQEDRYFYTCTECPAQYPWIRNEFGLA